MSLCHVRSKFQGPFIAGDGLFQPLLAVKGKAQVVMHIRQTAD